MEKEKSVSESADSEICKISRFCNFGICAENILGHEIIGLGVEVMKSTDKGRAGTNGRVIDETKNTITVEMGREKKVVPKKEVWLRFGLPHGKVEVNGPDLVARPEDRTKIWWRKYHG